MVKTMNCLKNTLRTKNYKKIYTKVLNKNLFNNSKCVLECTYLRWGRGFFLNFNENPSSFYLQVWVIQENNNKIILIKYEFIVLGT